MALEEGDGMDVDYDDVVAIVAESKTRLKRSAYMNCGTSIDLYKFSNKRSRGWNHGHIFRANHREDLFFKKGRMEGIYTRDAMHEREACFVVDTPSQQHKVQDMIVRSSRLKHIGVLKPYIAGFNNQISQVVSAFSVSTSSLHDWLGNKLPVQATDIPTEVQQMIRTGYLAIELIWREGSTSDHFADINSYAMIDNNLKINPMYTRTKVEGDDKMRLRRDFGQMIKDYIYSIWKDGELLDFIELLGIPAAMETNDVLEHPVLLPPPRRELMYHKFDTVLTSDQRTWLSTHADPGVGWKTDAATEDEALDSILKFQEQVMREQAALGQPAQQAAAPGQPAQRAAPGQPAQQAATRQPAQQAAAGQQAAGQQVMRERAAPRQPAQQAAARQPGQRAALGQPAQQAAAGQQVMRERAALGQPAQQAAARQPGQQAAPAQPGAAAGQQAVGFSPDFSGALHFASVTTAHYLRHYKMSMETDNWRENIKGRVDSLLKKVLPRLLSRCYNAKYLPQV